MYAMLSEFILENKTFALQEKAQTWQQAVKNRWICSLRAGVQKHAITTLF